ncbi:MAG: hypothetical protein D6746_02495, partial [Bacteroidetes bacterium]
MALVDFDIIFDFTGDYKLTVANMTVTGVPLESVTARVEVSHPNDITYKGSATNTDIVYDAGTGQLTSFSTPVYQSVGGEPYEGMYEVKVVVYSNDTYYTAVERSYNLIYDEVKPEIFADFDVFTPRLVVSDDTPSYEKAGFSANILKTWTVTAPFGGSWSATNADFVDLIHTDVLYYDSSYDTELKVFIIYQDNTYPWAYIYDELKVNKTL